MPGFEALTLPLVFWITLVVLLAAVVQGALGFGFPIIATPLIALVTDIRTAIIIVLLPCIAAILVNISKGAPLGPVLVQFSMMPVYIFVGAAFGTRLFVAYPLFPYALLLAVVIFFYLGLDRLGRTEWPLVRQHRALFAVIFGVSAGVIEGTANAAAPPLVMYFLAIGLQPPAIVQALNISFLTGKSTQFATLATTGRVTLIQWLMTMPLAGLAAAGALNGIKIRDRIDAPTYRRWVTRALFALAVFLMAQTALRWSWPR